MSLLNDASLILVPSAIKTGEVLVQKPLPNKFADETGNYDGNDPQGSANLTFTRASNATRVGPDGLIEKVRTNLALYSEDLTDAVYTKSNVTITANSEIAPDGTLTADTITATSTLGLTQGVVTVTSGLVYTMSGWLKRKTGTGQINLRGVSNTNTPITITNDWVRYSVSLTAADTTGRYGVRLDVSGDEVCAWGFQLEVGDIITDYIATTTAAVSVGPVANVPRLDYLGSSCGKLLLEPQRTNDLQFSEQADNAYWTKDGATISVNATASPSGYVDADKLQEDSSTGVHRYGKAPFSSGTQRTFSVFAKKGERDYVSLFENNAVSPQTKGVIFNLNTGTLSLNNDPAFYINPTITDYGNGWYRCSATWTPVALSVPSVGVSADGLTNSYAGTTGSGIFVWGAMLEQGSYSTSYIPTLGSTVTRLADSASKTGIASLIGQSEGTILWSFDIPSIATAGTYNEIAISDGTSSNEIGLIYYPDGRIQFTSFVSGSLVVNISLGLYGLTAGNHKFAFAYKLNDYVAYVDGVSVGTDTSAGVPAMSVLNLYNPFGASLSRINQFLLFKTRLSNAKLAELTTL
jgi:hypothetical protein